MSILYIFKKLNSNKKKTTSNQKKHNTIPNNSIKISIYNLIYKQLNPHKKNLLLFKLNFKLIQNTSI